MKVSLLFLIAAFLLGLPETGFGAKADDELRAAIKKGDVEGAKAAIDAGAALNSADENRSVLGYAVGEGNREMVALLIERGADVNRPFRGGYLPLSFVKKADVAKLLLEHGAKLPDKPVFNMTPFAFLIYKADAETLELLLPYDRLTDLKKDGPGLLMTAMHLNRPEAVKFLVGKGVDPNLTVTQPVPDGGEFIHSGVLTAAIFGNPESLKTLLDSGGKPCAKTLDGQCAIVTAISNQHAACAKLLWQAGCHDAPELSYQISQNATPDEVRVALARGLEVEPEKANYGSPLTVAAGAGKLEIAKILVEAGAGEKHGFTVPLEAAATNGHHDMVEYLLLIGGKPDIAALDGVVSYANPSKGKVPTKEDYSKTLDLLLAKIKLSDLPEADQHKLMVTAIFPCTPGGGPEVIQKLIANGINLNAKNKEGKTVKEAVPPNLEQGSFSSATKKYLVEILKEPVH